MLYLLLFYPLSASAIPEVRMENVEVTPNSTITIPIIVHNVENLGSGTIYVTYNPSIVHVVNVKSGTGNALEWNADNTEGIVRIVAWSANEPKSGDVIFANITFESLKEGFSFLNLSVWDLTDYFNYTKIDFTVKNGSILVRRSTGGGTSEGGGGGGGGGGGVGGYMPLTTPRQTEAPSVVERKVVTIACIEARKPETASFEGSDVYNITLIVDKKVYNVSIKVEKLVKVAGITDAPGLVFSYFNITVTNLTGVNASATVEFKVSKSWMSENSIEEETIRLYKYEERDGIGRWFALPTSKIGEDSSFSYFSAETSSFSLFAISGEVKSAGKTPQPTAAGIPQTLPTLSPTPSRSPSPMPASELTPTPIATTPVAPAPSLTINWFIIIAIIASSAIILTVLYLLTGAK
ncbi:MAG: PGF-pre-PGF domain-containing protein [Candidatus Methanospirare jalkutatii]|nr:MAG: PGF-pre-PGF domain-containing protein [Candidatus Methanospirare jalkutatii]